MKQKDDAVKGLTGGVAYLFKSNKVTGIRGHGTISAPGEVSVKREDGSNETLHAKNILIAVGSEVTPFAGIDVSSDGCSCVSLELAMRRSTRTPLSHRRVPCHSSKYRRRWF